MSKEIRVDITKIDLQKLLDRLENNLMNLDRVLEKDTILCYKIITKLSIKQKTKLLELVIRNPNYGSHFSSFINQMILSTITENKEEFCKEVSKLETNIKLKLFREISFVGIIEIKPYIIDFLKNNLLKFSEGDFLELAYSIENFEDIHLIKETLNLLKHKAPLTEAFLARKLLKTDEYQDIAKEVLKDLIDKKKLSDFHLREIHDIKFNIAMEKIDEHISDIPEEKIFDIKKLLKQMANVQYDQKIMQYDQKISFEDIKKEISGKEISWWKKSLIQTLIIFIIEIPANIIAGFLQGWHVAIPLCALFVGIVVLIFVFNCILEKRKRKKT